MDLQTEVNAHAKKLPPRAWSYCFWAEVGDYGQRLAFRGGSWCLCEEVGVLKFLKFFKQKNLGQNFGISKKFEAFELGQDFENNKNWDIRVEGTTEKVGPSKTKVGKKKHFDYVFIRI